jgi:hypothetical protein
MRFISIAWASKFVDSYPQVGSWISRDEVYTCAYGGRNRYQNHHLNPAIIIFTSRSQVHMLTSLHGSCHMRRTRSVRTACRGHGNAVLLATASSHNRATDTSKLRARDLRDLHQARHTPGTEHSGVTARAAHQPYPSHWHASSSMISTCWCIKPAAATRPWRGRPRSLRSSGG